MLTYQDLIQIGILVVALANLIHKIYKGTYIVRVYFSETSKETMSDKIKCIMKNEIQQMRKNDNGKKPGFRKVLAPNL